MGFPSLERKHQDGAGVLSCKHLSLASYSPLITLISIRYSFLVFKMEVVISTRNDH